MNKSNTIYPDQFDRIIINRLTSKDFGQPQQHDLDFYKSKATQQIKSAIKLIRNATNQSDFSAAIYQANAFIDAAYDYEFIDISEKSEWLIEVAAAHRIQTIGE